MNRRTLLVSLAGAVPVAGCLQSSPGSNETIDDPENDSGDGDPENDTDPLDHDSDDEFDRSEPDQPTHTVSVAGVDSVPDEHDLEIDVELLVEGIGPDETAHVGVTTVNADDARTIAVENGQCGLFDRGDGVSVDGGLVLKREALADPDDRDGERWTRDVDPHEPRAYDGYGCAGREFGSGESITNTYAVWDDYRTEGYLEAGTYRFENEVAIAGEAGSVWDDPDATVTWGFELEVAPTENGSVENE